MVHIEIEGREKLLVLGELVLSRRKAINLRVRQEMERFGQKLVRTSKAEFLSGPRPNLLDVVTGRLRRSITSEVSEENQSEFQLSFGSNVVYARIHEKGGVTGRKHKTVIKKRPFLAPSFESEYPAFRDDLRDLLMELAGRFTENG